MSGGVQIVGEEQTAKERDYILDYKSVDVSALQRVDLLDVPVDNVSREEAMAVILEMIERKRGPYHVMFLDPLKAMRLRSHRKLRHLSDKIDMILADGAGLGWAARKLGRPLKERLPMIGMIIDLVRLARDQDMTIYLLGSRPEYLEQVFHNWQRSFPGVRIIGRQAGAFTPEREELIKESLRKSSPDIVFVGMGFPGQELWIQENIEFFSNAVIVGVDSSFGILSGKVRLAPDWFQLRGLSWLWQTLSRPFLLDRLFGTLFFFLKTYWRAFRQKS